MKFLSKPYTRTLRRLRLTKHRVYRPSKRACLKFVINASNIGGLYFPTEINLAAM